jgi:hypothetical protein
MFDGAGTAIVWLVVVVFIMGMAAGVLAALVL